MEVVVDLAYANHASMIMYISLVYSCVISDVICAKESGGGADKVSQVERETFLASACATLLVTKIGETAFWHDMANNEA